MSSHCTCWSTSQVQIHHSAFSALRIAYYSRPEEPMQQYKIGTSLCWGPTISGLSLHPHHYSFTPDHLHLLCLSTIATRAISWHFFNLFISGIFPKHKADHNIPWTALRWLLLSLGCTTNSFQISSLTLTRLPLPHTLDTPAQCFSNMFLTWFMHKMKQNFFKTRFSLLTVMHSGIFPSLLNKILAWPTKLVPSLTKWVVTNTL